MRIGILSDTHNKLARTLTAIELLVAGGADVLIHCGDLTGPDIVQACAVRPCYFVFGNNDDCTELRHPMRETGGTCLEWAGVIEIEGKRLGVTHGHLPREARRLLAAQPDYFLFGHTHEPLDHREGLIRHINPGALHRAAKYTVALLQPDTDSLHFLEVPR
ncbi:MAG TPA: metallophosphoesterase family protein [Gemmataceae bacterium]|nr:metallophosphoesterase family protein [Gemmataceae bacterium]